MPVLKGFRRFSQSIMYTKLIYRIRAFIWYKSGLFFVRFPNMGSYGFSQKLSFSMSAWVFGRKNSVFFHLISLNFFILSEFFFIFILYQVPKSLLQGFVVHLHHLRALFCPSWDNRLYWGLAKKSGNFSFCPFFYVSFAKNWVYREYLSSFFSEFFGKRTKNKPGLGQNAKKKLV